METEKRVKFKRRFICGLLRIVVLTMLVTQMEAYPGESKRPARFCPENDPDIAVHAQIKSIEMVHRDESQIEFRAHVMISIANASAESVYVLAGKGSNFLERNPYSGAVSLARTKEDALSCHYIYNWGAYPGIDRSAYWRDLREKLDHKAPSPNVIRTIAPGQDWDLERDIFFGMGKDPMDKGPRLNEILNNPDVWLRVELLMWSNNLERDTPNFGTSLRDRWKGTGHLIIENLWTEPVEITLPLK